MRRFAPVPALLLAASGIGLVAIACASTLTELAPFPCAKDRTCPAGYSCLAQGCTPGEATDRACSPTSSCAEGACVGGVCLPGCGAGSACGPGRVCSYPAPGNETPLARCLADCTNTPCPEGLECRQLFGTTKACVSGPSLASLDKPCAKAEDCQIQYGLTPLPVTCARGTCAIGCSATLACGDPTRVCNGGPDVLTTGCLVDCGDAGTKCPEQLACKPSPPGTSVCGNPAVP